MNKRTKPFTSRDVQRLRDDARKAEAEGPPSHYLMIEILKTDENKVVIDTSWVSEAMANGLKGAK